MHHTVHNFCNFLLKLFIHCKYFIIFYKNISLNGLIEQYACIISYLLSFCCCCCSVAQSCPTTIPRIAARQASLFFSISWSLLKFMSIESVMPSNPLVLCHPLILLPSIYSSNRVFSNELALPIRCPKYWSFSFSISSSNEYSGLISFRID